MEDDLNMYKTLAVSRSVRIEELERKAEEYERRLSESEVLHREASNRAIDLEKDLTLVREERDKAFTEVATVSEENSDLVLKIAELELALSSKDLALEQMKAERDEARVIGRNITARELSTAEEWSLRASITMAQEFKDGKSHLWDLELWKKEYEAKFGALPQDSGDDDIASRGGEEEEVSSGKLPEQAVQPAKSVTDSETEKEGESK